MGRRGIRAERIGVDLTKTRYIKYEIFKHNILNLCEVLMDFGNVVLDLKNATQLE